MNNQKQKQQNRDVIVELKNGSITVSAFIYAKLTRKFADLTNYTIIDVLQYVTELTKNI